jgi:hypothetical protein
MERSIQTTIIGQIKPEKMSIRRKIRREPAVTMSGAAPCLPTGRGAMGDPPSIASASGGSVGGGRDQN